MPTAHDSTALETGNARTQEPRFFDSRREPHDRSRQSLTLPLPGLLDSTAIDPTQTRAPPRWHDSTTKPVRWQRMTPAAAKELYRQAEDFERQTRRAGLQDGALGRNGLAVLRALIFGFLNYTTGRLDPGYGSIAKRACISLRSVARGLVSLKRAGVLNWLRRCTPIIAAGRCVLEQITNAYALIPASQWRGYQPSPRRSPPPRPEPGTWGDPPALPDALTAAVIERRQGTWRGVLRELGSDPGDRLANALASLGRTLGVADIRHTPDVPA